MCDTELTKKRIHISPDINLGHLLTATMMLFGGIAVWVGVNVQLARQDAMLGQLNSRQDKIETAIQKLVDNQFEISKNNAVLSEIFKRSSTKP